MCGAMLLSLHSVSDKHPVGMYTNLVLHSTSTNIHKYTNHVRILQASSVDVYQSCPSFRILQASSGDVYQPCPSFNIHKHPQVYQSCPYLTSIQCGCLPVLSFIPYLTSIQWGCIPTLSFISHPQTSTSIPILSLSTSIRWRCVQESCIPTLPFVPYVQTFSGDVYQPSPSFCNYKHPVEMYTNPLLHSVSTNIRWRCIATLSFIL